MLLKNVAGQGVYLYAYDTGNKVPKVGDAANITAVVSKDGGGPVATGTTHPTEIAGGGYWQPLSQAEFNANELMVIWTSATTGVQIDPVIVCTTGIGLPAVAPGAAGGVLTLGTGAGQIAASSGNVPAIIAAPVTVGTNNDKSGYSLASAGLDAIVIESGLNARQALAIIAAESAGVLAGATGTTITFAGAGVATNRITAQVDTAGNRTAVSVSPPA